MARVTDLKNSLTGASQTDASEASDASAAGVPTKLLLQGNNDCRESLCFPAKVKIHVRHYKAQAALELLLVFTVTLATISLFSAALLEQNESARDKVREVAWINRAEAAACALEAWLNTGIRMDFDFRGQNLSYRIEQGRFHVAHEGKIIEVDGVYATIDTEPV